MGVKVDWGSHGREGNYNYFIIFFLIIFIILINV